MKVTIIDCRGQYDLDHYEVEKNDPEDNEIEVKTEYCGICRSDIKIYAGYAKPMPFGHFGHEGVGTVSKVGKNIKNVKEGDFVATTSDPAYGTYYNSKECDFVKIPELSHKYIIEPVACALNIIDKTLKYKNLNEIIMFGTGFLSMIIGQYCKKANINLTVVGSSHKEKWKEIGYNLKTPEELKGNTFSAVIDLSSKAETFDIITDITEIEGLIVMGSTPNFPVKTDFFKNSWNCHNFIFPSPRNYNFKIIMEDTVSLIKYDYANPEDLWTKGYSFNKILIGFIEGNFRTKDYIRGYLDYGI